MAKFCSEDCVVICDFCKHYRDTYRDIEKNGKFAGESVCIVDGKSVSACDGYGCENFECFRIK